MDYLPDVRKYSPDASEAAVAAIVKYCGIALRNRDSSMVSTTDPKEMATVKEGFATKKLGLTPEQADAGIKTVIEKLKGDRTKSRVTFYYLLAEATGTLDKLA
ncbi:MAG: DUF2853 family protein [Burkholderiaceae bacterium]|nr:DUF2853 family protein [Burkholderiaceae bacterium]